MVNSLNLRYNIRNFLLATTVLAPCPPSSKPRTLLLSPFPNAYKPCHPHPSHQHRRTLVLPRRQRIQTMVVVSIPLKVALRHSHRGFPMVQVQAQISAHPMVRRSHTLLHIQANPVSISSTSNNSGKKCSTSSTCGNCMQRSRGSLAFPCQISQMEWQFIK